VGLILDSSVAIAAERRGDTVQVLLQRALDATGAQEAAPSTVAVVELVHGIHRADTAERRGDTVQALLQRALDATTENTWVPDLSGRPSLTSRYIERTTTLGPDALHGEATLLLPAIDGSLRETERNTGIRVSPTVTADGGRNTIEEVRWSTERQIFERDQSGRPVPIATKTEETAGT
jgi:hypothetical protein